MAVAQLEEVYQASAPLSPAHFTLFTGWLAIALCCVFLLHNMISSAKFTLAPDLPEVIEEARQMLRSRYQKTPVKLAQGLCEEQRVWTLEEIFVNIILLSREDVDQAFADQTFGSHADRRRLEHAFTQVSERADRIHLADLFSNTTAAEKESKSVKSPCSVLALGCAGSGKSTVFCGKVACEWAKGNMWQDCHLLMCLKLQDRDVQKLKDAEELLQLVFPDMSSSERYAVLRYMRQHPERVCIVLDGLDECNWNNTSSYVKKLMKCEAHPGIHTLVTSRPCAAANEISCKGNFDRRVELIGFSPDNVSEYIGKVLDESSAARMKIELEDNPDVCNLMATPIIAALCCEQFRSEGKVPRCASVLFRDMISRLSAICDSRGSALDIASATSSEKCVMELGRLAFEKLLSKELVFSEQDLHDFQVSDDARRFGVLVECQKLNASGRGHHFRFSHLTLQEYLAAHYARQRFLQREGAIHELVNTLGFASGHTNAFWCFLSAMLNDIEAETLYSAMTSLLLETHGAPTMKVMTGGLCGGLVLSTEQLHSIRVTLSSMLKRDAMLLLADELLREIAAPAESGRVVVENNMSLSREPTDEMFLETLLRVWVEKVPAVSAQMLCAALAMVSPEACAACKCQLGRESIEEVKETNPEQLWFEKLVAGRALIFSCFAERCMSSSSSLEPSASIAELIVVAEFRPPRLLWDGSSRADLSNLAVVIQYHNSCLSSVMWPSSLPAKHFSILLSALISCCFLTKLSLCCNTTEEVLHWEMMAYILRNNSTSLTSIGFQAQPVAEEIMRRFVDGVRSCRNLDSLYLQYTSPSRAGSLYLAHSPISMWKNLKNLWLWNVRLEDAGVVDLSTSLVWFCSGLRRLELRAVDMSWKSLPSLAQVVLRCSNLTLLDLAGNDLSTDEDDGIEAVLLFVESRKSRPSMDMYYTSMEGTTSIDLLNFMIN